MWAGSAGLTRPSSILWISNGRISTPKGSGGRTFSSVTATKKNKHGVSYREAFIKPRRCVLKTMKEGDAFDLGGRKIEVYLTPGHSAGSVTLRDTLTGTLFTGDNVNPMVTLQYPGSAGLKAWIESAEKTLSLAGQAPIWGGHGGEAIEPRMIRTAIGFAEKLLKDPPKRRGVVTVQGEEKYPKLVARARRS